MKNLYKIFALIVLVSLSACNSASATPTTTPVPTKIIPTPTPTEAPMVLALKFAQKFTPTKCPDGSPTGAFCLNVSGTANDPVLGEVTMARVAVLNFAGEKDKNQCVPASTDGTLTIGSDTITYTAPGVFCPKTSIATYAYQVTGGTGAYANATGAGTIDVPPASSSSTGVENWSGTLTK